MPHDGMSDGFRKLLETPGYSIYLLRCPYVIMVIGKTGGRFREIGLAHLRPENLMLTAHALGIGSCWVGFQRK